MRYDKPIPFGWFALEYSDQLAPGALKTLRYFGRELVLFRTESGEARALDAYCPHLGAHLGHGGTVLGEHVACPFHGWQFDGDGVCREVPYATNMPPKVQQGPAMHSYPVLERNQMIWAWYHPDAAPPTFDVDEVPEFSSQEFTPADTYDWEINTIVQECGENGADVAHFMFVHNAQEMPLGEVSMDGIRRLTRIKNKVPRLKEDGSFSEEEGDWEFIHVDSTNIGPGQTVQRISRAFEVIMLGTVTPIDDQRTHLRFAFTMPRAQTDMNRFLAEATRDNVVGGVEQDIPIWNNKRYVENPILCDGDGPIAKYRKWFSQFYAA
ncbi:MAG: Rieske 2Fe-2S domain-containing protein [Halioglobus sp.]